jgi:hypothetical protein
MEFTVKGEKCGIVTNNHVGARNEPICNITKINHKIKSLTIMNCDVKHICPIKDKSVTLNFNKLRTLPDIDTIHQVSLSKNRIKSVKRPNRYDLSDNKIKDTSYFNGNKNNTYLNKIRNQLYEKRVYSWTKSAEGRWVPSL